MSKFRIGSRGTGNIKNFSWLAQKQFKKQKLLVIFILALAVSVGLGTISPVSTQTAPAVMSCEQLKADIKAEAQKDANADRLNFFSPPDRKRKNSSELINLYKDQSFNTSCPKNNKALWNIYINEYDVHMYPSCLPIFVILVLGVVISSILIEALKRWFNQVIEIIENGSMSLLQIRSRSEKIKHCNSTAPL